MSNSSVIGFVVVSAAIVGTAGYLFFLNFSQLKARWIASWREFRPQDELIGPSTKQFAIIVAVCTSLIASVVGYEVWVHYDIPRNIGRVEIKEIGTIKLSCSKDHFWGHLVLYSIPSEGSAWGRICRDWENGKWIFGG